MSEPKYKIKVRVQSDKYTVNKVAVICREVNVPDRNISHEVLAANGKWREKSPYDALFDDEKFDVEVIG